MGYSHVQSNSSSFASSSSARALAFTGAVTAGDLLLVWVQVGTVTITVTDSQSNTYTQIGSDLVLGTRHMSLWWAIAKSNSVGGANSVTVNPSATTTMALAIQEYSSTLGIQVDGSNTGTGTGTSVSTGSVPVTGNSDLAVCAAAYTSTATATAGGSYTLRTQVNTNPTIAVEDLIGVSTAQTPGMSLSASSTWSAIGVTFSGAPGGTPRIVIVSDANPTQEHLE